MPKTSTWLVTHQRALAANRRLVMFPHAGGSASFFRPWARHLDSGIELQAVQYPGRENRLAEPLMTSMADLANAAAEALSVEADRETVFFGHSMGAAVAYETLRLLEQAGVSTVTRLCVSGRELAGSRRPVPTGPRDDEQLIRSMTELGGTRSAVLDDPSLREMLLDIVRNDYLLIDTYRPAPDAAPVSADVIALTGDRDPEVDPEQVWRWASVTTGAFSRHVFPGGHFYLTEHMASILGIVTAPVPGRGPR